MRILSNLFKHDIWRLIQWVVLRPISPTEKIPSQANNFSNFSQSEMNAPDVCILPSETTPSQVSGFTNSSESELNTAVVRIYQLAIHRTPSSTEVAFWTEKVLAGHLRLAFVIEAIAGSSEALFVQKQTQLAPDISNGRFVQFAIEELLERGPLLEEIAHWDYRILHGISSRAQLVTSLFGERANRLLTRQGEQALHDPDNAWIMGTDRSVNVREWQRLASAVPIDAVGPVRNAYPSLALSECSDVIVSAIASLYCGGDYIEQFMQNITSQTIFARCELIIIDANSPENEFAVIARFMEKFSNIIYYRSPTRIGIYEAWNVGVAMARGRYITNTNMDDLRRYDSFERQAEILEKFPFISITYQDFYYSFDGEASFAKTAVVGVRSELPVVTPCNLVRFNSPHNAPMWRRSIHDDVGVFDATFRSAGDHDFWLRCVQAGKVFYKLNDPHVVYFVNPEGLSTRPNTRGVEEGQRTTREHGRKILSARLLSSDQDFIDELQANLDVKFKMEDSERNTPEWRYAAVQRALRLASAASRVISKSQGQ